MSNWDDTKRTAQSPFHDDLRSGEPAATPSQKPLTEQQNNYLERNIREIIESIGVEVDDGDFITKDQATAAMLRFINTQNSRVNEVALQEAMEALRNGTFYDDYDKGWERFAIINTALHQEPDATHVPQPEQQEAQSRTWDLKENEQLKAINAELMEMLGNVMERGLIYWEPQTERGAVAKAEMIEKVSTLLDKAQQVHQPAQQASIPEPEQDRDLEPDL